MRIATALALAAVLALAPAAMAQPRRNITRAETAQLAQADAASLLDGTWNMVGGEAFGRLTLTTGPNRVLEGTYVIAPCHGSYQGNDFYLFCFHDEIGTFIFSGEAREVPPVATQRAPAAGIRFRQLEIRGVFHDPSVGNTNGFGNLHQFRATRNG